MTWQQRGACVDRSEAFYRPQGHTDYTEAAALCAACPVWAECEQDRLVFETHPAYVFGFRAGRTAEERKEELRPSITIGQRTRRLPMHERQREVRVLTEAGWSANEIAAELGISQRSVVRWRATVAA